MLKELRIESFAIIDQLILRMEKGLLVVTGETGAGKSILFNALTLVMGKRASTEMIRHGSKQAIVSAGAPQGDQLRTQVTSWVALGLGWRF